jgi:hypothetical protein
MSSFTVSCVWLLTMVVAVVLAARPVEGRRDLLELAAVYAVAFGALSLYVPPSAGVGFIAGLSAGWYLVRPGGSRLDRVLAGVCAGAAAALYAACGLDRWLALMLGAGVMTFGLLLIPRRDAAARETILYLAGPLAVAIGLAPDVAAGWRSARLLNHTTAPAHVLVPLWAAGLLGIALMVGIWVGIRGHR